MKKILVMLLTVCLVGFTANAQTAELSKETKAAMKEAKEKQKQLVNENTEKALKQAGASDKEIAAFKETLQSFAAKGTEIRKDASLSEADKEAKLKENADAKNAELKKLLGDVKYKEYSKIRKEQKPAEEAIMAAYKQ
jgi:hypothetical protein